MVCGFVQVELTLVSGVDELRLEEDRQLGLKVQSLLVDGNPNVVAYAAKLGDVHVIREYLKNYPNEVRTAIIIFLI